LPNATYRGTAVDDLLISASARTIDGVNGILGQAGPDAFRSGTDLPYHGVMEFDSADLADLEASGQLEDLVPLGALLADLERFAEADAVYRQALSAYDEVSPFPLAWVCFQLGMLWGELVPVPDADVAGRWYQRAIAYVPGYVKARVHLAEIYASQGGTVHAESLLRPALSSRDPEVQWRLADVLSAQARFDEAERQLDAARFGLPTLGLTAGARTVSVAADGSITSLTLNGHVLIDVCAALS